MRIECESWPIAGGFTISRGSKTHAETVLVGVTAEGASGRGECVPYPRYGESMKSVVEQIRAIAQAVEGGLERSALQQAMPAGAARNAVDCALWDLEAKQSATPAWRTAGLPAPRPVITAFTLSLASPEAMAAAARAAPGGELIKLKLGGEGDEDRIAAVREAVPGARLIADANEGWTADRLQALLQACAEARVELVEQPLPAGADEILGSIAHPVAICADESVHTATDLPQLAARYDAVNIKLDKAGGLTGALALARAARERNLAVMVGCMLATSLAMAPALLLAQQADFVDLDGPLLLQRDRQPGLLYEGSQVHPPSQELWG